MIKYSCDKREYLDLFVQDDSGLYSTKKPISSEQIVKAAKSILEEKISKRINVVKNPQDLYDFLVTKISDKDKEVFYTIYLDYQMRIIEIEESFAGTINSVRVHNREILKKALLLNASGVILAHNHPSGSLNPSDADIDVTRNLASALNYIDVNVIDHIIIGAGNFFSMKENSRI